MRIGMATVAMLLGALVQLNGDGGYRSEEISESSKPVHIHCRVRYSTVIEFPQDEEIESAPIGDAVVVGPGQPLPADIDANWVMSPPYRNTLAVKPKYPGLVTSLVVTTKKGDEYNTAAFLLVESSCGKTDKLCKPTEPDIRFVVRRPASRIVPEKILLASLREDVAARDAEIDGFKQLLAKAAGDLEKEKQISQHKVDAGDYAGGIHADYKFDKHAREAPFLLRQVFDDGKFTRISCDSLEPPAFFEMKDGKLSMVEAAYDRDHKQYIVYKLIDVGVLRVGKKQVEFSRGGEKWRTAASRNRR